MTIAVALQVHDGVVLASDSATTITDRSKSAPGNILNVYNNANKIFNLRKGLPIGGMTYGLGSIGASSISTLAKDLRARFSGDNKNYASWHIDPENFTIEDVATRAREFLYDEKYLPLAGDSPAGSDFGFVVAGYSSNAELSEVWIIEIVGGRCPPPRRLFAQGETRVYAGGDPECFSRLVLGHSQKLNDALLAGGIPPDLIPAVVSGLQAQMHVPLIEPPMPIQDALEFAEFLVQTTAMFTRFKHGAPTVGGPVESAAITKHEGFKWVRRKHYFAETLNPRGPE